MAIRVGVITIPVRVLAARVRKIATQWGEAVSVRVCDESRAFHDRLFLALVHHRECREVLEHLHAIAAVRYSRQANVCAHAIPPTSARVARRRSQPGMLLVGPLQRVRCKAGCAPYAVRQSRVPKLIRQRKSNHECAHILAPTRHRHRPGATRLCDDGSALGMECSAPPPSRCRARRSRRR